MLNAVGHHADGIDDVRVLLAHEDAPLAAHRRHEGRLVHVFVLRRRRQAGQPLPARHHHRAVADLGHRQPAPVHHREDERAGEILGPRAHLFRSSTG
jgi:hypothetical protein